MLPILHAELRCSARDSWAVTCQHFRTTRGLQRTVWYFNSSSPKILGVSEKVKRVHCIHMLFLLASFTMLWFSSLKECVMCYLLGPSIILWQCKVIYFQLLCDYFLKSAELSRSPVTYHITWRIAQNGYFRINNFGIFNVFSGYSYQFFSQIFFSFLLTTEKLHQMQDNRTLSN